MRKYILFIFIMSSILYFSCDNMMENDVEIRKSYAVTASVKEMKESSILFSVKANWHNGCGRFSHFDYAKNDSTFYITVYGKQPKDAICTQAIIEFDAPVEIPLDRTGRYVFRFWRSDSTSLDTTIYFAR